MSKERSTSDEIIKSVDNGEPYSHCITVDFSPLPTEDIVGNYFAAVRATVAKLRRFFEEPDMVEQLYDMDPVLVAEGVDSSALESLPSLFGPYRVKRVVEEGSLFILDLSTGPHHATAAGNIVQQGGNYSTSMTNCRVLAQPDSTAVFPGCPDFALVAATRFTTPGSHVSPRIGIFNR